MNLYTLMTHTLALMGMTPDASTLELWRPRLIAWANEGLMDLGISLRLWHKEELEIENGRLYTQKLSYPCVKVLQAEQNGRRLLFYYGGSPGELVFHGVQEGRTAITYRYMPKPLVLDTDEPQLPENCRGLLLSYMAAKEKSHLDAASQNQARFSMALYRELKDALLKNRPDPMLNQFYNLY